MIDDKPKPPELMKCTFEQEEDTSSTRVGEFVHQEIEIERIDVAGDDSRYFVIKTERWAFDSIEELVAVLRKAGCT